MLAKGRGPEEGGPAAFSRQAQQEKAAGSDSVMHAGGQDERHHAYKMLRLRVVAYPDESLELSGTFGERPALCETRTLRSPIAGLAPVGGEGTHPHGGTPPS